MAQHPNSFIDIDRTFHQLRLNETDGGEGEYSRLLGKDNRLR
ncbi:hypothetical protein GGE68_003225 [Rhizobium leguminosarum]|nr:hypothetical protein [Rhizobium leguminosarum]MBB5665028.1 hypothetical protein [Rhizobium leguminosarum]